MNPRDAQGNLDVSFVLDWRVSPVSFVLYSFPPQNRATLGNLVSFTALLEEAAVIHGRENLSSHCLPIFKPESHL